ncbi:RNI-like protein [Dioscorea alata]|uniref:RNI-like protein n=1 Tax=Dioscorea alata TaxID=55571 RepID=A0ACB7U5T4_DIOAL|nr:RNI-like protein [Dioscorea alata]
MEKREGERGVVRREAGEKRRRWSEGMSPEVLALIFSRFPADELLRAVPFVCKSWHEAVAGPYCWSEIEIEAWCRRVNRTDVIDFAVRKLVRRSSGTLRRLSAYRIGDSGFAYAASFGKLLNVLRIPVSEMSSVTVEKYAGSLSLLTVLDISYCLNLNARSIKVFGNNCRCLIHLRRNMPPPEVELNQGNHVGSREDEEEALAVANTMPKLEQLELAFGRFSDHGLDAILTKCKALQKLDIRGCWNVRLDGDVGLRCDSIRSFRDPWEDEYAAVDANGDDDESSSLDFNFTDDSDDD